MPDYDLTSLVDRVVGIAENPRQRRSAAAGASQSRGARSTVKPDHECRTLAAATRLVPPAVGCSALILIQPSSCYSRE
jgi:hypothetical protein